MEERHYFISGSIRMSNNSAYGNQPESSIAVVGGGSIGIAFAVVFSRARQQVRIYDPDPDCRTNILQASEFRLKELDAFNLLNEPVNRILQRISVYDQISNAVNGVIYVQECAPENLELKRQLFSQLDEMTNSTTILASASSAISMSQIADGLNGKSRCLVTHPGNPPYLISVIEVVPSVNTDPEVTQSAIKFLADCSLDPILVHREIEGFVFNRLQGALLREAYCLVRDGIASVDDVDKIVRDGLGLRWSFMGPFETADLNTQGGIGSHAKKLGPAYARMGAERGQNDPWTNDLVSKVETARRELVPLDQWAQRVAWRDRQLMKLISHRMRNHEQN